MISGHSRIFWAISVFDDKWSNAVIQAFAEENHIADSPHHAQPCPLGQSAHDEPGSQADEKGGMQGAGAASCLREMDEGGGCRQEQQKGGLDAGKQRALRRGQAVGSL